MYKNVVRYINDSQVTIVAVSKKQPAMKIKQAWQQGARHFGENYLQEAENKIITLDLPDLCWHFTGSIQSNKTRRIAQLFDWVQTVDRCNIGKRLNEHRAADMPPLNVCIQVNIDREPQKAGCMPEDCLHLAKALARLDRLSLRGLMIIPRNQPDTGSRQSFQLATRLFHQIRSEGLPLDMLSMGMSQDYRIAIAEGSNMVRIGTAIFGDRDVISG